jgi:XPG I-region/Chromatin organization modifier domain 2
VGVDELVDHHGMKSKVNPWNFNQRPKSRGPTLAIDLSIWICESLTSSVIAENHADPTLHLVFTRTVKLLNLGVKLVGVLDGKRRLRNEGEKNELEKRRTGTPFWKASMRCEELFNLLGVPIVRAKAEGEALCALLNLKGVVDGIISNDGDCFLFGATTLYTKFSIENLVQGRVMRYDADNLAACLDDDDSDAVQILLEQRNSCAPLDVVALTRHDLIAFAILTGSDVAGGGFPKVGCRKALRFIRKCQIDSPLRSDSAALDEMMSWAESSKCLLPALECSDSSKKCSLCFHFGTKSSHLKHGCIICGTKAGEPCFQVSPGNKFRKSLRAKALALVPSFDPKSIFDIYQSPNDNQTPLCFLGKSSHEVAMKRPDIDSLLHATFIIRGRSYAESRKYILESLSRLMARVEISEQYESGGSQTDRDDVKKRLTNKNKPVPIKLLKTTSRCSTSCYEVLWKIQASTTDSDGNPIDEFEFMTIEEQATVEKCYPDLISKFQLTEKERLKQGQAEQERRRAFLDEIKKKGATFVDAVVMRSTLGDRDKPSQGRRDFFAKKNCDLPSGVGESSKVVNQLISSRHRSQTCKGMGDDVAKLLQTSGATTTCPLNVHEADSVQSTPSSFSTGSFGSIPEERMLGMIDDGSPYKFTLTPSHVHFLKPYETTSTERIEKGAEFFNRGILRVSNGLAGIPDDKPDADDFLGKRVSRDHGDATNLPPFVYEALPLRQIDASDVPFVARPVWNRDTTLARSDISPHLKRTKKSLWIDGTPPTSRNHPLLNVDNFPGHRDTRRYSLPPHYEASKQTVGGVLYGDTNCWQQQGSILHYDEKENAFASRFASKSRASNCPLGVSRSQYPCYDSLSSSDLDAILLRSFADVSIHTIPATPSPQVGNEHARIRSRNQCARTSHPLNEINLAPRAFVDDDDGESIHPTYLFPDIPLDFDARRRNHLTRYNHDIVRDDGVVNAALAKLGRKTRAAKMHQQNDSLLREALWQDELIVLGGNY